MEGLFGGDMELLDSLLDTELLEGLGDIGELLKEFLDEDIMGMLEELLSDEDITELLEDFLNGDIDHEEIIDLQNEYCDSYEETFEDFYESNDNSDNSSDDGSDDSSCD